jgi:DNA-binding NarL/FixJ family response regulator
VPTPEDAAPDILVVDLDLAGAPDAITAWRQAHPEARAVGFAFHAEEALIARIRAAGVEVIPHGATARPARLFT